MGTCQCFQNNNTDIDINLHKSNTRMQKLMETIQNEKFYIKKQNQSIIEEEKENDEASLNCNTKTNSPSKVKRQNTFNLLISDRKSKHENSQFDYKEHSIVIFEVFNYFRLHPFKYFKKLIKNNLLKDIDIAYFQNLESVERSTVLWSEKAYDLLYNSYFQGKDHIEEINDILNFHMNMDCDIFCVLGDYDPELVILILLKENMNKLDLLLNERYSCGTVCSYSSEPDITFFYLIKKN
jgi:hypothetical protein